MMQRMDLLHYTYEATGTLVGADGTMLPDVTVIFDQAQWSAGRWTSCPPEAGLGDVCGAIDGQGCTIDRSTMPPTFFPCCFQPDEPLPSQPADIVIINP